MKRIFGILFALVLVLSLSLVTAVPAAANSVASSTMHFEGSLTYQGGGVYTGTIPATAGTYYVAGGPGTHQENSAWYTPDGRSANGGFDVYAKYGGTAYVQGMSPDTWTIGPDHDAYSEGGPWGSWYDPDCADWDQYSLELTEDHWYLRYTATGESPMSGELTWYGDHTGYAAETDKGTDDTTADKTDPVNYPYAAGSAQEWGWNCGWGEERIPLQYPGFALQVTGPTDGGVYHVTLMPAGSSSTALEAEVPDIVAISASPTSIDFGTLYPGDTSAVYDITVENIGTHQVKVDADVSPTGGVFDNLQLKNYTQGGDWSTRAWPDIIADLNMGGSEILKTKLVVPQGYTPQNEETATLIFEATATP